MWLKDKSVLVTGSSRGIGRGIAVKLASSGAGQVCVTYLTEADEAKQTLEQVCARGAAGFICQLDVTKPESITNAFSQIKERFGRLDVLVSNARAELADFYVPVVDIPLDKFDAAFAAQSRAFHLLVREMLSLNGASTQSARIVAITYAPGSRTGSWQPWAAIGSAKAAMESLVRYYAVALAQRGITVNAVSPGATDDSVLSRLPPEAFDMIKKWHEGGWTPMRRLGTPADIGNAVSLFCTQEADFITGQILHVDGGASVMDPVFPLPIQGI
jgi:NAD(P)-dependent dehydrogenase (short-subunit alcohol dehydrogenase family)